MTETNEIPAGPDETRIGRRSLLAKTTALAIGLPTASAILAADAGAARRESAATDAVALTITFVGSLQNFPFWNQIQKGAVEGGRNLAGVKLKFTAPTTYTGLAQINNFIKAAVSGRPAGLAVDYRAKEFEPVVKQALDRGIKVAFYNNSAPAETAADPRVRKLVDSASALNKVGVCQRSAKAFQKYVKVGDELVFFNQLPGSDEWDRIQDAYVQAFTSLGWPKSAIKIFPAGLDPAKNLEIIQSYLTAHPNTKGIVCADVIAGSPAVKAKQALGLKTPLLSWNLDTPTFADIKNGNIAISVNQQPYLQSYYAVVNLYQQLRYGFIAPPAVDPGTLIIDKSNVAAVEAQYKAGRAG